MTAHAKSGHAGSGEHRDSPESAKRAESDASTDHSSTQDESDARERAKVIPEAAVARLAVYLRALSDMQAQEISTVSSEELATAAGVNSAKLRKDLSYIGSYGTRGVGYETAVLIGQIERTLGLMRQHSVAVVGIGNLGHALANYPGFPGRGFPVAALFDLDADLIGVPVGGIPVNHVEDIVEVCAEREITIGVIGTPAHGAQEVCDRLVAGGVTCILNFAPIVLQVPENVEVRKVDLAVEMQILSFHMARRQQDDPAVADTDGSTGPVNTADARTADVGTGNVGTGEAGAADVGTGEAGVTATSSVVTDEKSNTSTSDSFSGGPASATATATGAGTPPGRDPFASDPVSGVVVSQ